MLRIAMITDHSASEDKVDGGVQAVTRYLVAALTALREIDLHVVGFSYGRGSAETSVTSNGYTKHVLPGAKLGTVTAFKSDQRELDKCLQRIDPAVVHGQGAGHNGILASRSRFPAVITVHGILAEEARYYSGAGARLRHRLLDRLSERHCIRGGRHTILISPYVADCYEGRLAGRRYLIPNPVADEFFRIPRQDTGRRVLFAGRLYALKGVLDLVRAAAEVARSQEIELVLAGSLADRDYVQKLRTEARRLGIEEQISFRGLLNEEELREELGRSAALVLPSYQETAPMVIAEAMAAGVPVIASKVGGVGYQVRDGETGYLFAPGDVDALSARLLDVLGNRKLRESLGAAGRDFAAREYRAENVARRTVDAYRQALV